MWPVLSIIFSLGLYRWLTSEGGSFVAELGFLFAMIAFATVAAMISIQLAVRMGFERYLSTMPSPNKEWSDLLLDMTRMVDMGLDVAWDVFIGSSLVCIGVAMLRHFKFGKVWGTPSIVFGAALIVLNVMTFPFPPNTAGLFDIGPVIGSYILAVATKMIVASRTNQRESKGR